MKGKTLLKAVGNTDLRLLSIFRTVVDCGGLAASEFELNIGRSAISRHLSDLESRLGMRLCDRGPAGFSLTAEGEKMLEASEQLLVAIDQYQGSVNDIQQNLRGFLNMAVFDLSPTNPLAHVDDAIREFETEAPEVSFELSIEPPNVIESGVVTGRYDVGVIPVHRRSASLNYLPLYREDMILYCGNGHPLFETEEGSNDLVSLSHYKYAGFSFNSPNMIMGQKMNFRRSAHVQNEEALLLLILSGRYLGFLPSHVADYFVNANRMKAIEKEKTRYHSTLAAVTRKRPNPSRKTEVFYDCLKRAHPNTFRTK